MRAWINGQLGVEHDELSSFCVWKKQNEIDVSKTNKTTMRSFSAEHQTELSRLRPAESSLNGFLCLLFEKYFH